MLFGYTIMLISAIFMTIPFTHKFPSVAIPSTYLIFRMSHI